MDLLDSLRRAVRHYPGSIDAVAARLGKSPSTLEKELRGAPQYKMGAVDAADIAAMCLEHGGQFAAEYPTRVAETVGGMLVLLPRVDEPADRVTATAVATLLRECADMVTAAAEADADGYVSTHELQAVERKWAALVADGQLLLRHLSAKHQKTMERWNPREGGAA